MEEVRNDGEFRSEGSFNLSPEPDALNDALVRQFIRLREAGFWIVLSLFVLSTISTFALFYLSGLGILSFSDNVLISLSGVLIGEMSAGAILMVIAKSLFPNS